MKPLTVHRTVGHLMCIAVLCLFFTAVQNASAQEAVEAGEPTVGVQAGRYGVGFASAWPAYGISGTMQISETLTAEAVMGFFGSVSNFGGKGWYRFNRNTNYDLYAYASASVYRYGYTDFVGPALATRRATESVLGLGGGVHYRFGN